tara:strand:+ start:291 stop:509 length:219 start_codon:yes stop_codon:yes gene_type:complete
LDLIAISAHYRNSSNSFQLSEILIRGVFELSEVSENKLYPQLFTLRTSQVFSPYSGLTDALTNFNPQSVFET